MNCLVKFPRVLLSPVILHAADYSVLGKPFPIRNFKQFSKILAGRIGKLWTKEMKLETGRKGIKA